MIKNCFVLVGSPDEAVIWRGAKKSGLIKQFLRDVDWDKLDFLLVDTPPGTSDEHLALIQFLSGAGIDGVVIVTTPQEVALCDVRKEISFCRKTNLPIIGIVENMSDFVCPKCHKSSVIFPPTTGGAIKMSENLGEKFLGSLPLDPRIAKCCDEGKSFIEEVPDSPAVAAFQSIVKKIISYCNGLVLNAETGESVMELA